MSPKTFIGWSLAAVAMLAAAIFLSLGRPDVAEVELANEPAFPELRADPDAVARIVVRSGTRSFTLERGEAGAWSLLEKSGYPASAKQVKALIVALADMRLARAMTRKPERFARLELEDPAAEEAKSKLLRLEDADGGVLAEAIVGKSLSRFTAGSEAGTYLRRPGEEQAWLASGRLELKADPLDWLEKDVVHVAEDRVRRVAVTTPEGKAYVVSRAAEGEALQLENPPEGRVPRSSEINRLGAGMTYVGFDDLRPAAELERKGGVQVVTVFSFDGLEVTAEVGPADEGGWATFKAAYVGAADDESEGAKKARQTAARINGRVEGWAYKLQNYVVGRLTMGLEQLLEKPEKTS